MQNIIKELDLSFQSSVDYLRIFYDVYMDSQIIESSTDSQSLKSRIVVQIAHGMVEHKGRYEWVGMQLAQKGFVVVINDHRGHGKSIDSAHPWGEMKGKTQGLGYAENTMDTESLNKMQMMIYKIMQKYQMRHKKIHRISVALCARWRICTNLLRLSRHVLNPRIMCYLGILWAHFLPALTLKTINMK